MSVSFPSSYFRGFPRELRGDARDHINPVVSCSVSSIEDPTREVGDGSRAKHQLPENFCPQGDCAPMSGDGSAVRDWAPKSGDVLRRLPQRVLTRVCGFTGLQALQG